MENKIVALTVRMPEELHRALKVKCATEGTTIQNVMMEASHEYLKRRNPPKTKVK